MNITKKVKLNERGLLRALVEALGEPDYNLVESVGVVGVYDYRGIPVTLLNEARVAVGLAPVSTEVRR